MVRTYSYLPNYSVPHNTSHALSCAMELVDITDSSYFRISAYQITAGTTRSAELRPELSAYSLNSSSSQKHAQQHTNKKKDLRSLEDSSTKINGTNPETVEIDEFGDDDFKDLEVINAGTSIFLYGQYTKY